MALKKRNVKVGSNSQTEGPSHENKSGAREPLFSNRPSLLDVKQLATEHALSTNLTGFYHFYWITLTFFIFSTLFVNWFEYGYLLSGNLMRKCFRDAEGVVIGELIFLVLVIVAGVSIFVVRGFIQPARYIIPVSVLFIGSSFGFYREWSGLQRSIYLLHSLSVFMKIYAFLYHHRNTSLRFSELPSKFEKLFYFAFAPTMIYSESYPKSQRYHSFILFIVSCPLFRIRKSIVLERLAGICLCGISMYVVVEEYILPVLERLEYMKKSSSNYDLVLITIFIYSKLILPCNTFFLLGFFFVFEYWCNLFAELTCFADRQFYTDWWNGISFYDFSTRWNIPVHKFLQKYIYRHLIHEEKYPKRLAMTVTFLFSSVLHELIMFVMIGPGKYIFTFLFVYQMLQIPLISLVVGTGWAKKNAKLANWVFWVMMVIGIPTVVLSYALFAV